MLFQAQKPDALSSLTSLCSLLQCFLLGGDEGNSSPVRVRQEEARVPPETSAQFHLRGLCCERGIGSFGARRHRTRNRWGLIHMKAAETLLCKNMFRSQSACLRPKTNMYFGTWEH